MYDGTTTSAPGIVWLIPPHQQVVTSDFATDADGWAVEANGARQAALPLGGIVYEPYSRGLLNHYVIATDAEIFLDRKTGDDMTLWRFVAPAKFLGNHAITCVRARGDGRRGARGLARGVTRECVVLCCVRARECMCACR